MAVLHCSSPYSAVSALLNYAMFSHTHYIFEWMDTGEVLGETVYQII